MPEYARAFWSLHDSESRRDGSGGPGLKSVWGWRVMCSWLCVTKLGVLGCSVVPAHVCCGTRCRRGQRGGIGDCVQPVPCRMPHGFSAGCGKTGLTRRRPVLQKGVRRSIVLQNMSESQGPAPGRCISHHQPGGGRLEERRPHLKGL
jgi:hypothetical protein